MQCGVRSGQSPSWVLPVQLHHEPGVTVVALTSRSVDARLAAASVARIAEITTRELRAPAALAVLRIDGDREVIAGAGLLPASLDIDPRLVLALCEQAWDGRWHCLRDTRGSAPHAALRSAIRQLGVEVRAMRVAPAVDDDGALVGVVVAFEDVASGRLRRLPSLELIAECLVACRRDPASFRDDTSYARSREASRALDDAERDVSTGVAIIDRDGRIAASDAAFARLVEADAASEVIGLELSEVGLPRTTLEALRRQARQDGGRASREVELSLDHGRPHRVELRLAPATRDGNGDGLEVLTIDEASRLRSLKRTLARTRERLRMLERAASDVIWEFDVRTGRIEWGAAGAKQFRFLPSEVKPGIEWHIAHIHPDDRERTISGLQSVLNGIGHRWRDEYRFQRGDGTYAWVMNRAFVIRNERNEPTRIVGWMVDVTERKRIEEGQSFLVRAGAILDEGLSVHQMLESLARYCVPAFGDCCVIDLVDARGAVQSVAIAHSSATAERLLREWIEHRRGEDDPAVAAMREVIRANEARRVTDRPQPPDGRRSPLLTLGPITLTSLIIVPISAREQVLGTLAIGAANNSRRYQYFDLMLAESLAHRAALAIDNARLYETSRRALRDRQDVLGLVSHDLRAPLSSIMLAASLLREDEHVRTEEGRRRLSGILDAARQMNTMIGDLLDASRIESGHFSVRTRLESPAMLLQRAQEMFTPLAQEKGLALHVEMDGELRRVHAERDQISRVLANLIGNAIKFTPRGGTINVRASQRPLDVLFSIDDTGPGLTPDQMAHVFQPFWTADRSELHGTGLGLAIAHGIVEAHGGQLWVDKSWTRGSRFVFTLPCESAATAAAS